MKLDPMLHGPSSANTMDLSSFPWLLGTDFGRVPGGGTRGKEELAKYVGGGGE